MQCGDGKSGRAASRAGGDFARPALLRVREQGPQPGRPRRAAEREGGDEQRRRVPGGAGPQRHSSTTRLFWPAGRSRACASLGSLQQVVPGCDAAVGGDSSIVEEER